MPANKRDVQGLVYFATRLRNETHGCNKWDEAGTFKIFTDELLGTNLAIALERVIGHATDPDAKTPGAIKRPFTPEPKSEPVRRPFDPREHCNVCYREKHVCQAAGDHLFVSVEAQRARAVAPMPDGLREAIADKPTAWPRPDFDQYAAPAVAADEGRMNATKEGA